jgi:hypothetical protein
MVPASRQTAVPSEIRNPAVMGRERSMVAEEPVERTGAPDRSYEQPRAGAAIA